MNMIKQHKQTHMLFIALLTLLLGTGSIRADTNTHRYVSLYEKILKREESKAEKSGAPQKLWLADIAVRLAQRTGRPEYGQKAVKWFESALPDVARLPSDFHTQRGIALALFPLRELGLLNSGHEQVLRPIAERTWKEFLASPDGTPGGDADHNIRLAQALACAEFARLYQDDKILDAGPIRQRLESYWVRIKATGDLDEDASNYSGLGLVHCIELAHLLGHEQDLRAPGFRRMFERQRDIISPTGLLPEFGDGFFHLERDSFDFLYLCEYAAGIFDDPAFLTVARRLYDPVVFANAKSDAWCRAIGLLDLKLSTRTPAPLPAESLVNYRANRNAAGPVVDKLILRTGNAPGDAMVLMDLYAAGSHAHPSKGPSVAYYEVDGVPLFHNLGRHRTRSAITGNSFWAMDGGRAFPGVWKPGGWFTMTIPVDLLLRDATGAMKIGDRISFRTFENKRTEQLWFDYLRLEGKAGVKLLDGFESAKTWHRGIMSHPGIVIETSSEHTQGAASQSANWGTLKAGAYARMLADSKNFNLTRDEFDAVKMDVKYEGIRPYLHLRDLTEQIDLGDHALIYQVGSAQTEQRGRDASGKIVFSRYIAADAQLTRRLVLTSEGFLVIHDRWSSGKSQAAWTAGQLWQFYALHEQGADWFCSEDDGVYQVPDGQGGSKPVTRRMLVKFSTTSNTSTFVEKIDQDYLAPNPKNRPQKTFFTLGSKRAVTAGTETAFTMVVTPHAPDRDPKPLADAIRFVETSDGVEVMLGPPAAAAPVRVALAKDGSWNVSR